MSRREFFFTVVVGPLLFSIFESQAFLTKNGFCSSHRSFRLQLPSRSSLTRLKPLPSVDTFVQRRSLFCLSANPLIAATDDWGNIAVLLGIASSAQVVGKRTVIGRMLGPPVSAMTMAFVLASIGILNPGSTPAAKNLQLLSLQLATPLVLLAADLRDAAKQCGPLLVSFAVAAIATMIACGIGWGIFGSALQTALGTNAVVIAAALMAKNIGGGINYIAVCQSLQASPMAIAAGLCVDNLFALLYFPATSFLSSGLQDVVEVSDSIGTNDNVSSSMITVQSVSNVLCIAAVLLWAGDKLGGASAALPLCSLFAVVFATVTPRNESNRSSAELLGSFCLYVFFATAGAPGLAVADSVKSSLIPLGGYLLILYSIHGSILWFASRWNIPCFLPQRLLVASSAAIGGPATAIALADAAGWKSLRAPSILVGNIGYAIATFCGLVFARFVSSW